MTPLAGFVSRIQHTPKDIRIIPWVKTATLQLLHKEVESHSVSGYIKHHAFVSLKP